PLSRLGHGWLNRIGSCREGFVNPMMPDIKSTHYLCHQGERSCTSHSIATLRSVAPGLSRQPSLLRVWRPVPEELSGRALHDQVVCIPSRTSGTVRRFGHCCRDMIGIPTERGWPPTTRAQFDAVCGPTGALLIGDAETVAAKILYDNEVLGGISRT